MLNWLKSLTQGRVREGPASEAALSHYQEAIARFKAMKDFGPEVYRDNTPVVTYCESIETILLDLERAILSYENKTKPPAINTESQKSVKRYRWFKGTSEEYLNVERVWAEFRNDSVKLLEYCDEAAQDDEFVISAYHYRTRPLIEAVLSLSRQFS